METDICLNGYFSSILVGRGTLRKIVQVLVDSVWIWEVSFLIYIPCFLMRFFPLQLHQLMPSVITCLVAKRLGNKYSDNHWELRDFTANLVASICKRWDCPCLINVGLGIVQVNSGLFKTTLVKYVYSGSSYSIYKARMEWNSQNKSSSWNHKATD